MDGSDKFTESTILRWENFLDSVPEGEQLEAELGQMVANASMEQAEAAWPQDCPVDGCVKFKPFTKEGPLRDHLAEVHGYELEANEYITAKHHLKRKTVGCLKTLFVRDVRKLIWNQARLLAVEGAIRQHFPAYESCHNLSLYTQHTIGWSQSVKKQLLIDSLVSLRNELNQKGELFNEVVAAQGTWEEVYEDLLSKFNFDDDDRAIINWQAELRFIVMRCDAGDVANMDITPGRAALTDELVAKPGCFLPPKVHAQKAAAAREVLGSE